LVTVLLLTMLCIFVACIGGLVVIALRDYMAEDHPHRGMPDGFMEAVRFAFDPTDTRTGRVRLLLAAMGNREATEAGASTEPAGLHRATP
jgi:hypothetical protein